MVDKNFIDSEDEAQIEWCRQWLADHQMKMTAKQKKKLRRIQHKCNIKYYLHVVWYELVAYVKGV